VSMIQAAHAGIGIDANEGFDWHWLRIWTL
jgi:hypothetical protein